MNIRRERPIVSLRSLLLKMNISFLIIILFQEKTNNKRMREEEDNSPTSQQNQTHQGSSKGSQGTSAKGMRMTQEMKNWGQAHLKRLKAMQEVAKLGKQIQMGLDWAKSLDNKSIPREREESP